MSNASLVRSTTSNPRRSSVEPKLSTTKLGSEPAFLRTSRSAWTPALDPHNNNKLFLERVALITHWHDKWKDRQRKQLLVHLLHRTEPSQLLNIRGWLLDKIPEPVWQCDPGSVLPKWLVLYVFSYLNVAQLCQVCQVSSHWHYLAEQDVLWRYRAAQRGWYLPYRPPDNMFGAWKSYYVLCATNSRTMSQPNLTSTAPATKDLDYTDKDLTNLSKYYVNVDEGGVKKSVVKKKVEESKEVDEIDLSLFKDRWNDPDPHPKELLVSDKVMSLNYKPDLTLLKKKKKSYARGVSEVELTLTTSITQQGQFVYIDNNEGDTGLMRLSTRTGVTVPRHNAWLVAPKNTTGSQLAVTASQLAVTDGKPSDSDGLGSCDIGCGAVWGESLPGYTHPAVLLISSDTPAYEVLMGAVITGVICVVYDAEESSLSSLIHRVEHLLKGRRAACIGLVVPGKLGVLHITRHSRVQQGDLQTGFWRELVTLIREPKYGGRVEIFSSIGVATTPSKELGLDILYKLTSVTSVPFNGPIGGVYGELGELAGPWLFELDHIHPPQHYFKQGQFIAWVSLAQELSSVTVSARVLLHGKLRDSKALHMARVVEAVVREAWCVMPGVQVPVLADILFEAIQSLEDTELSNQPEHFKRGILCMKLVEVLLASKDVTSLEHTAKLDEVQDKEALSTPEEEGEEDVLRGQQVLREQERQCKYRAYTLRYNSHRVHYPTGNTLDQRRAVVEEIYRTERDYLRELKSLEQDVYIPLYTAAHSDRPLMNPANIKITFTDILAVIRLHEVFYAKLQNKLRAWNAGQGVGDVLTDITSRIDCYTNFINNYPAAIATYEKCLNKNPAFWAFVTKLNKHAKSLPETLLLTFERIERYEVLVKSLFFYTPDTNSDKEVLSEVFERLGELRDYIKVSQTRYEQIRVLQEIERRVINCPALTDSNRNLIKELVVFDVKSEKMRSGEIIQTEKMFPLLKQYTVFLFNDNIMLTTTQFIVRPFDAVVEEQLHFISGYHLSAVRITTTDHPAQFVLYTPRNIWLLQCEDSVKLRSWINDVNVAIANAPRLIIPNVYVKSNVVQVFH